MLKQLLQIQFQQLTAGLKLRLTHRGLKCLTIIQDIIMDKSTRDHAQEVHGMNENDTPFIASVEESPESDPHSSKFRYEYWLRYRIQDVAKCRQNAMGVAYQKLNVCGFGSLTAYQKTFANYPLAFLRQIGRAFSWRQEPAIDILQGFEGLVNSGEMLLVLGRPGSGCSTLLKVLSGRTHGLNVDAKSTINYQGKSQSFLTRICSEFREES